MDVLAIKNCGRLCASHEDVVECTLYKKHGLVWFCPDPQNKTCVERLEREYQMGEWSGKESRWITKEEYQKWNFGYYEGWGL